MVLAGGGVGQRVGDVQAVTVEVAAAHVADGDHLVAQLMGDPCCVRADVAETLDGYANLRRIVVPQATQRLVHADHHAAPGGLGAALAATNVDRLAGDDGRDGIADGHAVGVHDPGHRLGVGAHVRGGDVAVRADEQRYLAGVAAGQPF